jgi:hypothetical protein
MHFIVLTLLFGSGKIVPKLVNYMDKSSIVQSLSQGKKGYTMKKLLTVALVAAVACGCISVNKTTVANLTSAQQSVKIASMKLTL